MVVTFEKVLKLTIAKIVITWLVMIETINMVLTLVIVMRNRRQCTWSMRNRRGFIEACTKAT